MQLRDAHKQSRFKRGGAQWITRYQPQAPGSRSPGEPAAAAAASPLAAYIPPCTQDIRLPLRLPTDRPLQRNREEGSLS